MTTFKVQESDGSKITVAKYRCKNSSCQSYDHMRSLLTSLTNSDSIKAQKEFADQIEVFDYDDDGTLVLLGCEYREESESYEWNFVECRKCQRKHIVEKHYSSSATELSENAFPLF